MESSGRDSSWENVTVTQESFGIGWWPSRRWIENPFPKPNGQDFYDGL